MNLKRSLTLVMVLCSLFAFLPSPGIAADNDKDPSIYFRPSVRFGTDDRTLYIMDFFIPLVRGNKDILFFNPRFTPSDTDGGETNLGIGYRHLLFNDKLVLGGNVFYDTRRTGWGTYWDQVGFGFEAMADFNKYVALTGRFNYYIPLTDPIVSGSEGSGSGYYFRDLGIYTSGGGLIEEAPEGFDAELGFRVPYVSNYVETWVYGGGYHYHGDYVGDVDGWSARLEVIPTDFLRLNYEYREDRTNQGEHHGEVAFEVPFSVENLFAGKNPFAEFGKHIGGSRDIKERMVESVHRDIDIRVITEGSGDGSGSSGTEVAGVVFVSENAPNITGTPDGSFAHPFATVAAAVAAIESGGSYAGITTIHVMNDSGSLIVNGGLVDLASLLIWGSGLPHPTYGYIQNQYLGNPDVTGLSVTADNVEVFGANFVGTTGMTTSGTGTNVHDNYFTAATGLSVTGGSSLITNNTFGGTYGVYGTGGSSTITNNTFGGTYGVYGTGGTSTVTNNDFLGNAYGIYANGGNFTITGNTIGSTANPITYTGIYLGSALTGSIVDNNTIVVNASGTDAYGIASDAASLALANNDITVTSGSGTAYGILGGSSGGISGSITGGTITASGNTAYGIYLHATGSIGSSGSPFAVSGVTVNASGTGDTYGIALATGGDIYGVITGSDSTGTSTGGYGYGIYEAAGTGNIFGSITGGTITGSGIRGVGIYLAAPGAIGDSGSPFTVSGNMITGTSTTDYAAGFMAYADGGDIYAILTGNTITATSSGYIANGVYEFASGSLGGGIYGGSVTASGLAAEGAYLCGGDTIGSSTNPYTISGVTIDATGTNPMYTYGVRYLSDGYLYTSIVNSSITARDVMGTACGVFEYGYDGVYGSIYGSTITAAGTEARGVELRTNGSIGSVSNPFAISWNTITATGSGGVAYGLYEYANVGDIFGSITGGSVTANGTQANGIYLNVNNGSIGGSGSPFAISGVTINATGTGDTYGLYMNAGGDIYGVITGSDSTGTSSGGYGYGIYESAGTGNIFGSITGGTITGSGIRGVGIYLAAPGAIGDSGSPFTVSGNTITGISTTDYAAGFMAYADGGDIYALLTGNTITATSSGYIANGVYEFASGDLGGGIYGGSVTASGLVAEGAYLCGGDTIGSSTNPYTISGVTIDVTATFPMYTYGVRYLSDGYLYTSISNSSITANNAMGIACGVFEYGYDGVYGNIYNSTITATGVEAHGVELRANGSIGSSSNPFAISGTTITTTGSGGNACGLYGYANNGDIFGSITGGGITGTSTGGNVWGIYLEANAGSIGGSTSPFIISGVTITGTGTGDTYGLAFMAGNDIYAEIVNDYITSTSTNATAYGLYEQAYDTLSGGFYNGRIVASGDNAYGACLEADSGSIYFTIFYADITATGTGTGNTYGLALTSGNDLYAETEYSTITAGTSTSIARALFEDANGSIYGGIDGSTIAADGNLACGVYLHADGSIGNLANPFTISDSTVTSMSSLMSSLGVYMFADSDFYLTATDNDITSTSLGTVSPTAISAYTDGVLYGGIWGGTVIANGRGAAGVRLVTANSIGSSSSPFTVSWITITASGSGDVRGIDLQSYGNIYAAATSNTITSMSTNATAYGVYEYAYNNLFGSITGGGIVASGDNAYGAWLETDSGSIGSSGDYFTISYADITATGTGTGDTYGLALTSGNDLYAKTEYSTITAGASTSIARALFEDANGSIYGGIDGSTIAADGNLACGVYLHADGSIGNVADPFTISDSTVTSMSSLMSSLGVYMFADSDFYLTATDNDITSTSLGSGISTAISAYTDGVLYGGIWGGTVIANGRGAAGVRLATAIAIGSSSSPFTVSGATIYATGSGDVRGIDLQSYGNIYAAATGNIAYVTSDLDRYFMYLVGSGTGISAIGWTGNAYAPFGGAWSGNYDTSGFVTNGPLYLDGITDAEVTP